MIRLGRILIEVLLAGVLTRFVHQRLKQRYNSLTAMAFVVLCFCAAFVSASVSAPYYPRRTVTFTALNEKNPEADGAEIYIKSFTVGKEKIIPDAPASGNWVRHSDGVYCWFEPGNEKRSASTTESISFELDLSTNSSVLLMGNLTRGYVRIETDGRSEVVDTYRAPAENFTFHIPKPRLATALKGILIPAGVFTASFLVLSAIAFLLVLLGRKMISHLLSKRKPDGLIEKYLKHSFLFEELVNRDFKKKYKRTVLGMAWSILSPLMTLLVMRAVFTQLLGRNVPHYTTYLFCGTLLFAFFKDSTNQGMTSLISNANIFTKINVPKYLFLFSKNVQNLINFGLTICVFFVFCIIDNITFTWKFVLLLYPIACIMLFNLGLGLILSALFVFFRDIQYLWDIFTRLLTYLSAIFYTIDRFSPQVQNLFLLNPVYLFIRYFRKIVIDGVIPTWQFHALMLADVAIALGVGCWMYHKYNTEFLYYV